MAEQETNTTVTPGRMLRSAREQLALSTTDIARKMHLSRQTIEDIENDDYNKIRALVYIRGYLRRYAEVVKLPEQKVLACFDALGFNPEADRRHAQMVDTTRFIEKSSFNRRSSKRTFFWGAIILVFIVVAMIVLWWLGQNHRSTVVQPNLSSSTDTSLSVNKSADSNVSLNPQATQPAKPANAMPDKAAAVNKPTTNLSAVTTQNSQPIAAEAPAHKAEPQQHASASQWQPTYHIEPAT